MSGFNTKTPFMDWSSFMRRDFQKENGIGALANAFNVVADTADGYGETADKKLLSDLVNETDPAKIDNSAFYSKDNALKAKNIIETNKNLEYQQEQRNRANELNARSDAEYAINQFNKEAIGDAINMDKASFDAKYGNTGGLDWAMMQDTFYKKEDRQFAKEDREQKNKLTNLQIQNTQNSINNQIEERNYTKEQRDKNTQNEANLNNLVGKYNSWDEFKKSEDWNKPEYNYTVKKTFYDSFEKNNKETSLTDQIKLEEINNNKKDLVRVQEEYKKAYGTDMPISEQSKFVYKGELPEKIKQKDTKSKDLTDKTATTLRDMIVGLEDMQRFIDSYNSEFTGVGNAFDGMVGDWIGVYSGGADEAKFRSQLPLITGPIVKAIYGGHASDSDKKSVENAMPTFRDNEESWKSKMDVFYKKSRDNFNTNINILKEQGVDTSAYEAEYNRVVPSIFGKDVENKPEDKKIDWQKPKKINLEEKLKELEQSKNKNITNQNKQLTSSEAEALGITFQ